MSSFDYLKDNQETLHSLSNNNDAHAFYAQEANRFITIAGTILANQDTLLDVDSVDARYISHILSRSLIENFFKVIYIFDSESDKEDRYQLLVKDFQKTYKKLMDEEFLPHKDKLEPAKEEWRNNKSYLDIRSMLGQVKNNHGDKLDYLYFIYRITSFDTHGNNLKAILSNAFNKEKMNFPILYLEEAFNIIADEYIYILNQLKSAE